MALRHLHLSVRVGLSIGLVVLLLVLAPFAVAQDVHHALAAADTDGHEHSAHDICQWVDDHIAGSIDCDLPRLTPGDLVWSPVSTADDALLSATLSLIGPSRAPPSL
ncbi:MAG: hypothetical protein NNA20_07510 [Nitrospira sp.]|nr:hypothetical protein [Nitrospira sp.]MCP9442425.1 hypothetical protein [Nitrospira sp.]